MSNHRKLCLLAVIVVTAVLIFGSCLSQPEKQSVPATLPPSVTPTTPEPADWPMFRFSLDHSGYNASEQVLKPPLELKWRYRANSGSKANSSPALVNGTIYVGSGDSMIYALDAKAGIIRAT
jgi:glucose dehydrogenase